MGTSIISGRVVDDETSDPIGGVRVTRWLSPTGGSFQHEVITDSRGRFLFTRVGAGRYKLVAEMPGYAMGAYGRKRAAGPDQTVQIADGAQIRDIVLRMFRTSPEQLTGRVRDEFGDPVVGITLYSIRLTPETSGPPAYGYPSAVQTDDRGEFRMFLSPGQYGIVVPPSSTTSVPDGTRNAPGRPSYRDGSVQVFLSDPAKPTPPLVLGANTAVYPLTTYPEGFFADVPEHLTILRGGPAHRAEIRLASSRAAKLSGIVTGPAGPLPDVGVRLIAAFTARLGSGTNTGFDGGAARTDARGRFMFVGVAPGRYELEVLDAPKASPGAPSEGIDTPSGTLAMSTSNPTTPRAPEGPTHWARLPVTVSGADIQGLDIMTQRGARGLGRVVFDGVNDARPSAAALARLSVWWQSHGRAALLMPTYPISNTDEFRTAEYPAGHYVINALMPTGWVIASATYRGRDVLGRPIELDGQDVPGIVVTLTNKVGTIKGTVRRPDGTPDRDATVFLLGAGAEYVLGRVFPVQDWKTAGTGDDGTFTITAVKPGDYRVLAVSESLPQMSAGMFKLIKSAGTGVTVGPLGTAAVEMRSVAMPGGVY